jgi:membrane protease YdiL (CAAX protease family)
MDDQEEAQDRGGDVSGEEPRAAPGRRAIAWEAGATTAAVILVIHLLYITRGDSAIGPKISYIVAYLLMGAPMLVLWLRRRPIDFFSLAPHDLAVDLKAFAMAALVIFPPFFLIAHGWQRIVWGAGPFSPAGFPGFINFALVQLLLVALPEEFFFRGYLQSALNRVFAPRWRVLGAQIGWGFFITAAVFAFAHTAVTYRWWHFSIFFPALVFGWLRERTGSVIAPTLFHATANVLMDWFVRCYA